MSKITSDSGTSYSSPNPLPSIEIGSAISELITLPLQIEEDDFLETE